MKTVRRIPTIALATLAVLAAAIPAAAGKRPASPAGDCAQASLQVTPRADRSGVDLHATFENTS